MKTLAAKKWSAAATGTLLAVVLVGARGGTTPAPSGPSWRGAEIWDDGRAEFSVYAVEWARYGNKYSGSAQMVVVKEPWAPELDVKADRPRPGGFEVLKLVHARSVRTGVYVYQQTANVFVVRDSGALQKIATTSSELCGISVSLMARGRLETHSYFDGEPHRVLNYPQGALPEDGLPLLLRDYVQGAAPAEVSIFPSLMSGRFLRLEPQTYVVSRNGVAQVETPAGIFDGVEIRLSRGQEILTYTFDAEPPFGLLGLDRSDGTTYRLAKRERIPYWEMHQPGDEAWIPAAIR